MKRKTEKSKILAPWPGRVATLAFFLLVPAVSEAADLPSRFPEVNLIEDSAPRYVSLRLDPWGNQVVYLLFDGTAETGYQRFYVWSPGDAQYNTPALMSIGTENRFPVIRRRSQHKIDDVDEQSEIAWNLEGRRVGGGTHFDYMSGETEARTRGYRIYFNAEYVREKRGVQNSRMAMTVPGWLPWTADWSSVGVQGEAPWDDLRVQLRINSHPQGDRMAMRLSSYLHTHRRHEGHACTVTTMPSDFMFVNVSVAPYLKDPLYASDVSYWNLERTGVEIPLDPRWYTIAWNYELHPWLGGATRRHSYFMSVNNLP